jgi:hypothetical protein
LRAGGIDAEFEEEEVLEKGPDAESAADIEKGSEAARSEIDFAAACPLVIDVPDTRE